MPPAQTSTRTPRPVVWGWVTVLLAGSLLTFCSVTFMFVLRGQLDTALRHGVMLGSVGLYLAFTAWVVLRIIRASHSPQ